MLNFVWDSSKYMTIYSSLDHTMQHPIQLRPPSLAGDLQISPAHSVARPGPLPAFAYKMLRGAVTFGRSLQNKNHFIVVVDTRTKIWMQKIPGLMDEGCRNHTANPILTGWAVHPSETLCTHEIALAIVSEEEHGALLNFHMCERSVPSTSVRAMSSTSVLSWMHEVWSISTAGPSSTSTILTSRMTKRGKCHCTVAGTPQKIWSYPLQRAAKHPGHTAFQEMAWQTLQQTSTLQKSFSGSIPLNKMPDISKLNCPHVDIWNNQRKALVGRRRSR